MDYQISRSTVSQPLKCVGWFGCTRTDLPALQNSAVSIVSIQQCVFQPGGGREFRGAHGETLVYVLSGQISIRTQEEQTILSVGDVIHLMSSCAYGLLNESAQICALLIIRCKSV